MYGGLEAGCEEIVGVLEVGIAEKASSCSSVIARIGRK